MNSNPSLVRGDAAHSRRSFLGGAVATGLATVPIIGAMNRVASAAGSTYDANSMQAFKDIQNHENDHVKFLKGALGAKARPKPSFKNLVPASFGDFYYQARIFESVGVGAYLGALPAITNKTYANAAATIALVEARHAGFLAVNGGHHVTTNAAGQAPSFEAALTQSQVANLVSPYISSLNGGPAASYSGGDDISILNFALLLEYLEAEFYNANVPKYV